MQIHNRTNKNIYNRYTGECTLTIQNNRMGKKTYPVEFYEKPSSASKERFMVVDIKARVLMNFEWMCCICSDCLKVTKQLSLENFTDAKNHW